MPTTNYQERMRENLAKYKTERLGLGDDQQGVWSGNGKTYSHILPISLQKLNSLETIRSEFWQYLNTTQIKLHKDFAHLNSSQALAFNLFFPFFGLSPVSSDATSNTLLQVLGFPWQAVNRWDFERVLDPLEETALDFCVDFMSGQRLAIEVKLTEQEFGAASSNVARLRKLREIYAPRLMGKVRPEMLEETAFFSNYQLLRNISYADASTGHQVIFLLPRANTHLDKRARDFLNHALLPAMQPFVSLVHLEDVVHDLIALQLPPLLSTHMELFREKYIP